MKKTCPYITPLRPEYTQERLEHTRKRLDRIPDSYRSKKIVIFGDAQRIESKCLIERGFNDVISCEYEFPEEGQVWQNIEEHSNFKADIVWASHVLEHCYSLYWAAYYVHEMLTHGGEFFVHVPSEEWGWHEPYHLYSLTYKGWVELFKRARFRNVFSDKVQNKERIEYFYRLEKA